MNKIKVFIVNAFANKKTFKGNPAAVCPLESWLSDDLMQSIAFENNLSETAFFVKKNNVFFIRWFTPKKEIELCGHATLAAAHVLFNELGFRNKKIEFNTFFDEKLIVKNESNFMSMDFPAIELTESNEDLNTVTDVLGLRPSRYLSGNYGFAIFNNEDEIIKISPKLNLFNKLSHNGVIVTSPGKSVDFVSRFFAPNLGINEDPVTGSAHCALIPYWSKRLKKLDMVAHQLSDRKGEIFCSYYKERVWIGGNAVTYLKGELST